MDKKIAYFAGCTANFSDPDVGKAAVLVLEKNGLHPVFPRQGCCAVPQIFYGDLPSFFRHAEANVRSLVEANCDIVTSCTSCALTLKRDYPRLLQSPDSRTVAARTYDILEYLSKLHSAGLLNIKFNPVTLNLAYHAPCHLKALGPELIINRLKLLNLIPGISAQKVDRGCCGMAGTFGIKKSNYQLSLTIGKSLFTEIKRLAPDRVITDCPGCTMQIGQGTGIPVIHPILIVKAAYGIE